jgi:hypothetical protein
MTTTGSPAVHISAAIQAQGKAIIGGVVAAVVAAEAPLVQGGHWSLNTLYAAAVSAVVGYLLVWVKANGPSEVTALLGMLVGHTHATSTPAVAVLEPVAPAVVAEPVTDAAPTPASDLQAAMEAAVSNGKHASATPPAA